MAAETKLAVKQHAMEQGQATAADSQHSGNLQLVSRKRPRAFATPMPARNTMTAP